MQTAEYQQYIKSPEWEQKKAERMEIDGYCCVCCGRHISHCRTMQVHHISYKDWDMKTH